MNVRACWNVRFPVWQVLHAAISCVYALTAAFPLSIEAHLERLLPLLFLRAQEAKDRCAHARAYLPCAEYDGRGQKCNGRPGVSLLCWRTVAACSP